MAYGFQSLPQLVDHRHSLPSNGSYKKRSRPLSKTTRAWHHGLTPKNGSGSNAAGYARYHVGTHKWPAIGYHLVIEPQNVIDTPKGKRARIVYCNDVELETYHVGNSNWFCMGISVAGDYRTEKLDAPTKASIDELQEMLVNDNIGNEDKSHHELPGYAWKACCEYNYEKTFEFLDGKVQHSQTLPNVYEVQQGDTLWAIANNDARASVEKLMEWNDIDDPTDLEIGMKLHLVKPSGVATKPKEVVQWTGYVKVNDLNVRKGPGVDYPTDETLRKNTEVPVFREENGWLYIGDGSWVSNVDGKYIGKQSDKPYKYAGDRVEAKTTVNFYDSQRWTNPTGQMKAGYGFTIIDLVKTEGSKQYKVKNSAGHVFYVTAREDLVRVE